MISRRTFAQTSIAAGLVSAPAWGAARPVLVELFTSQGCSSCPPADEVLAKLSARPDVVAVAFHVDYWDHLGWKDPFASPAFTRRQRDYRAAFGNRSVYTPQMVFNGTVEFPGQSQSDAARAVDAAARSGFDRPALSLQRTNGEVIIEIGAGSAGPSTAVFGAVYGMAKTTRVSRGENAGRTLDAINIAKGVDILGRYGGEPMRISWRPNVTDAAGLAVWLQPEGLGAVSAAAQLRLSETV